MKTAEQVAKIISDLKAEAADPKRIAWEAALACVGWPYVYGAWGAECTVAERKKRYREEHPTIRTKCRAYDGGSCSGCQWFPDGQRVRCFDCRGFTDWILKQAGIIDLEGEGATSQWNTNSNWSAKGTVKEGIPQGVIVCLFYPDKNNPKKMAHTGLYYCGETVECSNGVEHSKKLGTKWTHWAVPNGQGGSVPVPAPAPAPEPEPAPGRPTLRRGSKGDAVAELQTILHKLGYDLGDCGIDGDFGRMTESAVMNFQSDHGLTRDGVCGAKTWNAVTGANDSLRPAENRLYTVCVPHCTVYQAEGLIAQYPGSYKTAEEG